MDIKEVLAEVERRVVELQSHNPEMYYFDGEWKAMTGRRTEGGLRDYWRGHFKAKILKAANVGGSI